MRIDPAKIIIDCTKIKFNLFKQDVINILKNINNYDPTLYFNHMKELNNYQTQINKLIFDKPINVALSAEMRNLFIQIMEARKIISQLLTSKDFQRAIQKAILQLEALDRMVLLSLVEDAFKISQVRVSVPQNASISIPHVSLGSVSALSSLVNTPAAQSQDQTELELNTLLPNEKELEVSLSLLTPHAIKPPLGTFFFKGIQCELQEEKEQDFSALEPCEELPSALL